MRLARSGCSMTPGRNGSRPPRESRSAAPKHSVALSTRQYVHVVLVCGGTVGSGEERGSTMFNAHHTRSTSSRALRTFAQFAPCARPAGRAALLTCKYAETREFGRELVDNCRGFIAPAIIAE